MPSPCSVLRMPLDKAEKTVQRLVFCQITSLLLHYATWLQLEMDCKTSVYFSYKYAVYSAKAFSASRQKAADKSRL